MTRLIATLEYFYSLSLGLHPVTPVLPPFIIEQIRQREEQERLRREADRPRLQLPIDAFWPAHAPEESEEESGNRGVAILEL